MVEKLLARATSPTQYDLDDISWSTENGLQSPTRKFFFDYLLRFKGEWSDADILDIGCGTGWLMHLLKENGAKSVEGIEPSHKNVAYAGDNGFKIYHSDLDSFSEDKRYDLLISVMTFGHIDDLNTAFEKMARLVRDNGGVQLIVPAYDYFKRERDGCKVEFEELDPEEYVVQVTREQGTIAEIVRKVEVYERAAKRVGLAVEDSIPMVPTDSLMRDSPRHAAFKGQPITYLVRLRK
ncbi:hypothetical protein COV20_00910 [Candidatus Woesearchaeota archaeon CG10_big_fil_rev_8_21_14_0_10_45_16]|nr:MAG: hypothetical protein COV20_00910 [Candidatus Woesearchaeota archaeon CG10_big_fil_rev_8_21_14_0_10_45_16]